MISGLIYLNMPQVSNNTQASWQKMVLVLCLPQTASSNFRWGNNWSWSTWTQVSKGSASEFPEISAVLHFMTWPFPDQFSLKCFWICAVIWKVWLPVKSCYFLDVCGAACFPVTFTCGPCRWGHRFMSMSVRSGPHIRSLLDTSTAFILMGRETYAQYRLS